MKTFENFLIDKHAEQYIGSDDGMPDDYEDWFQDLELDDIVMYAEEYGQEKDIRIEELEREIMDMREECERRR